MKKILLLILNFVLFITNVNAKELIMTKYFKTTYYDNSFITKEISSYEYNNLPLYDTLGNIVETEYKKLTIERNNNLIKLGLSWKKTPNYLSFDVISLSSDSAVFDNNTIFGNQFSNIKNVNYDCNSQNTRIFANGFGISMNLVDNANSHNLIIQARINSGSGRIYGNYRHARRNVTLNDSTNYYLSNGNIIFYNQTINNYYDSINPVWIDI